MRCVVCEVCGVCVVCAEGGNAMCVHGGGELYMEEHN